MTNSFPIFFFKWGTNYIIAHLISRATSGQRRTWEIFFRRCNLSLLIFCKKSSPQLFHIWKLYGKLIFSKKIEASFFRQQSVQMIPKSRRIHLKIFNRFVKMYENCMINIFPIDLMYGIVWWGFLFYGNVW